MKKKIILVDMDGVLVDFAQGFKDFIKKKMNLTFEGNELFKIENNFPEKYRKQIWNCKKEKNFFLNLKPITGSIEAIKEMNHNSKLEIFICTTPSRDFKNCVPEKYMWVKKYLGQEFVEKIIMTRDKTLVYGDILIDDNPYIKGKKKNPSWEQIFFDQVYNRKFAKKRICNWKDWKKVIFS